MAVERMCPWTPQMVQNPINTNTNTNHSHHPRPSHPVIQTHQQHLTITAMNTHVLRSMEALYIHLPHLAPITRVRVRFPWVCHFPLLIPTIYLFIYSEGEQRDPRRWAAAIKGLETLKHGSWTDGLTLDFWLTAQWQRLGCPDIRYIQVPWMMCNKNVPTPEEIVAFRHSYHLPLQGPCPVVSMAGLLNTGGQGDTGGNHYCCIIWRPREKEVHVLGRNYTFTGASLDAQHWEEWGGPIIWRNLTLLHGWGHIQLTVKTLDWKQNGYDCGPIACQVLQSIWIKGFELTSRGAWKKPGFPCCHPIRMQITSDVHLLVMEIYQNLTHNVSLEGAVDDNVVQNLEHHPNRCLNQTLRHLERAMQKCSSCIQQQHKESHLASQTKPSIQSIPGREIKQGRAIPQSASEPEVEVLNDDSQHLSSDSDNHPSSSSVLPAVVNKGVYATDWSQARLGRFPRRPGPQLPALTSLKGLWSKFDPDFDDYDDGPTLEDLDATAPPQPRLPESVGLVYMANHIIKNPWRTFKDQGYRILPSYADQFHRKKPIMVIEHLMPVGISHPSQSTSEFADIDEAPDVRIMGAEEMLEVADDDDLMFLTGRTFDDNYICLDLENDAVEPEKILHSYDIDSLIWITPYPHFWHALNIFTMPQIRRKPPLWKHNHVYIELLLPQSENDRLSPGKRSEWWTRCLKLSSIPHVSFGRLGDGAGSISIYLFFPRMTHRDPNSGRWMTMVPPEIQNDFWANVLTPAMQVVTSPLDHPYVGLSRANLVLKTGAWRRRRGGEGARAPTYPFQPSALTKLIVKMKEIVSSMSSPVFRSLIDILMVLQILESDDDLAQFGSMFFIAEMKGGKHYTKAYDTQKADCLRRCFSNFAQQYSGLDWDYMHRPENGTLLIDLGVTHYPLHPTPLSGLWRLRSLEASFSAAGFNSGTIHHLNTLSLYGGLQAEMSTEHRHRSHGIFRSAYNQAYEVTRPLDNNRELFTDKGAHDLDPEYLHYADEVSNIYMNEASCKAFGVRDEIRMGGEAFLSILDDLDEQVTSCTIWLTTHFADMATG